MARLKKPVAGRPGAMDKFGGPRLSEPQRVR